MIELEDEIVDKEYLLWLIKSNLDALSKDYCTAETKELFLSIFENLSKLEQKLN